MPKLRLLGATKIPWLDEYTTRTPTAISPEMGFSSPAIERSVVVLPQPEGPSSVNSLPSGTSNDTSCAAFTTAPCSLAYSVKSDLTLSTSQASSIRFRWQFLLRLEAGSPDHWPPFVDVGAQHRAQRFR